MTIPLVSNPTSSTSFGPSFKLLTIIPLFLSVREPRFPCFLGAIRLIAPDLC